MSSNTLPINAYHSGKIRAIFAIGYNSFFFFFFFFFFAYRIFCPMEVVGTYEPLPPLMGYSRIYHFGGGGERARIPLPPLSGLFGAGGDSGMDS